MTAVNINNIVDFKSDFKRDLKWIFLTFILKNKSFEIFSQDGVKLVG